MNKNINWAMIGCGQVTEIKSGPGLYKAEYSKLYGVYDVNIMKAQDYANRHNVEFVFNSIDELLASDEIDIVYIATPPKFHKEYAIKALNKGKNVYVEKPISLSHEETMEICKLANEKKLKVYVAFYRRGQEKYKKIKDLIESGEIGKLRMIKVTQQQPVEEVEKNKETLPWRLNKEISGGGKFIDMALHILDIIQYIVGDISEMDGIVDNIGKYYEVDDIVLATFKCNSKLYGQVYGSGSWCYVADKDVDLVELIGDEGRIEFAGLPGNNFTVEKNGEKKCYEFDVPENVAMPYEQEVVYELLGMARSSANLEQAIKLDKFVSAMYKKER